MIIGKYLCERCGNDCTPPNHLWGFGLMIRGAVNSNQQKDLEKIKEVFGKNEFVWCWRCVAEIFGAKTLAKKEKEGKALKETLPPNPEITDLPTPEEIPIEQQDRNKPELKPAGDKGKFFRSDNRENTE